MKKKYKQFSWVLLLAAFAAVSYCQPKAAKVSLLNVSYDPTREFYHEYNEKFARYIKAKESVDVEVKQSHGGSGKQARSVIDGLEADIVTLALSYDIDTIVSQAKLLPEKWQSRLPNNSSPYTSTIVFLVRKGNPKGIKDWDDLIKTGIGVITPNPKTSGGARWNYLAAWGFALKKYGSEDKAKDFVKKLFQNVPVLDAGARGSTNTFVQRQIGDVLLAWENEAHLSIKELGKDKLEIVYPSVSILAEPPVAVVDANVKKHKTEKIAQQYLEFLYDKEIQKLIAKHYYRPSDTASLKEAGNLFPDIKLLKIAEFGGWHSAQKKHFSDNGIFDQIFEKSKQ